MHLEIMLSDLAGDPGENISLGTSLCFVKILVGETPYHMEGPPLSKMETGNYLFPHGAIDISVYLKKSSIRNPVNLAAA